VMPTWTGNEFLLPDGRRPTIRTFTPRRLDPQALELDLEIVVHGDGAASEWAATAAPGDPAAVSGPGRGYAFEPDAPAFRLGRGRPAHPPPPLRGARPAAIADDRPRLLEARPRRRHRRRLTAGQPCGPSRARTASMVSASAGDLSGR